MSFEAPLDDIDPSKIGEGFDQVKPGKYHIQVNDVKFTVTGARKIVIEGCKTTNASDFKKIGESKGKKRRLICLL